MYRHWRGNLCAAIFHYKYLVSEGILLQSYTLVCTKIDFFKSEMIKMISALAEIQVVVLSLQFWHAIEETFYDVGSSYLSCFGSEFVFFNLWSGSRKKYVFLQTFNYIKYAG